MGIRNKFGKWIAIVLLSISVLLIGLVVTSRANVLGQSKASNSQIVQAPSPTQEHTPPSVPTSIATPAVYAYEMRTFTDSYGLTMTYYLYVPKGYNPQHKYPLVLLLHGGGESANPKATPEQNMAVLLKQYYTQVWTSPAIQQKWPSFIVIPQVVSPNRWVDVPAATGSYTMAPQPSDSLRHAQRDCGYVATRVSRD
jgi:hypothetical protein